MRKRTKKEIEGLIQQEIPVWIELDANRHQMHHYLHLAAALGASREPLPPKLALPEDAVSRFMEKFKLLSRTEEGSSWFGLNAGAEYGPAKRWPEERFIQAAMQLQRGLRCRWLVFGGAGDKEGATRITAAIRKAYEEQFGLEETAKTPPVFNLAGATSLGELCAGLKLCRVLLTNDSGPMHVAAALGTPVVALFGSTSPELTGPGLPGDPRHQLLQSHVPCSPCFLRKCPIDFRCMNGISVDQAVWSVMRALG
jgi:heptosyltransferase-2